MIRLTTKDRGPVEGDRGVRVGRDAGWSDLVLTSEQISRQHLEIHREGKGYHAQDVGSRNGTTVNGRPLGLHGEALEIDDVVVLGGAIELVVDELSPYRGAVDIGLEGSPAERLRIELREGYFRVVVQRAGKRLRDTIAYQLGNALSLLALYQRDGMGPVSDDTFRRVVWRGDRERQARGDVDRAVRRLVRWFERRKMEPPVLHRPEGGGSLRLGMPSSALQIKPDAWLYRYLGE